jgi:hypothetical protein
MLAGSLEAVARMRLAAKFGAFLVAMGLAEHFGF